MSNLCVKVWLVDCSQELVDNSADWQLLDTYEQERANNFKQVQQRYRYVTTYAKLRTLLGDVVKRHPAQLTIARTEYGKPYLPDFPHINFNLSHSGDKLAIAIVEHCEVGIDIEIPKPRKNLHGLVQKCFAKDEAAYWEALPEQDQASYFYQLWVCKEAFIKATGRGIALGLDRCVFNPANLEQLLSIPKEYGAPSEWQIRVLSFGENLFGAVVAKSQNQIVIDRNDVSLTRVC